MGLLRAIDVCAGTGIGSWAFERIGLARTVCYIERDKFCQRLLRARMQDGSIGDAPLWDDLTTFDGRPWRGRVDFVFGGIPCQPWSVAGKRAGAADERDLWPAFRRLLVQVRPRFALVENVPGFASNGGLERMVGELAALGYDAEWDVLSAAGVGAHHLRKRVWVVAYANGAELAADDGRGLYDGQRDAEVAEARWTDEQPWVGGAGALALPRSGRRDGRANDEGAPQAGGDGTATGGGAGADLADAQTQGCDKQRLRRGTETARTRPADASGGQHGLPDWAGGDWPQPPPAVERGVRGVADGLPSRVEQLRALGNAWVPQVAEVVGRRIAGALRAPPQS